MALDITDCLDNMIYYLREKSEGSPHTLESIGVKIGLSKSTLSKIINKKPVDKETQEKVFQAVIDNHVLDQVSDDSIKLIEQYIKSKELEKSLSQRSLINSWIMESEGIKKDVNSGGVVYDSFLRPLQELRVAMMGETNGISPAIGLNADSDEKIMEFVTQFKGVREKYRESIKSYLDKLQSTIESLNVAEQALTEEREKIIAQIMSESPLIVAMSDSQKKQVLDRLNEIPSITAIMGFGLFKESGMFFEDARKKIKEYLEPSTKQKI